MPNKVQSGLLLMQKGRLRFLKLYQVHFQELVSGRKSSPVSSREKGALRSWSVALKTKTQITNYKATSILLILTLSGCKQQDMQYS